MENFFVTIAPIVEEAGRELARDFGKVDAVLYKTANQGSAVTELDRKTERFLADRFQKLYPDIAFFGEEFGGNKNAERFWLVDPIDGTGNFIRGIPFATTMISLVQSGQVTFSLIYNFVTKEMYSAEKGGGAKLNGQSIHVSNRSGSHATVGMETHRNKKENLDKFLLVNSKYSIITTHNSGFEHCLVASGKIEGRICLDPHGEDWDYAPGSLLISEAGGIVRNIGSDSYDFRNHDFIAANPLVYEELIKLF